MTEAEGAGQRAVIRGQIAEGRRQILIRKPWLTPGMPPS